MPMLKSSMKRFSQQNGLRRVFECYWSGGKYSAVSVQQVLTVLANKTVVKFRQYFLSSRVW